MRCSARQNAASKEIGKAAPDERADKIEAAAKLKEELAAKEQLLQGSEAQLRSLALQLPNPADASVPEGGEDDFVVLRAIGDTPPAPALDHAAFAEAIGFVDTGARRRGERFPLRVRDARGRVARARARAVGDGAARRARLRAGRTARARARAHDGRGGLLPDRSGAGVRGRRRRAVPHRHERGAAVGVAAR